MAPNSHSVTQPGKRNRILFGLILILGGLGVMIYFSRSPKPPAEAERSQLEIRDGKLYFTNSQALFTGLMLERYPDGTVQSRSAVSNGVLHGVSWGYYTNGQKQVEELFQSGTSEGIRTKWYPSGAKMSEATIRSGKLTGTFRRWYENGMLAEEVAMNAGVADGPSVSYYPSGFVKVEATLDQGKVVHQKSWNDGEGKRLPAVPTG